VALELGDHLGTLECGDELDRVFSEKHRIQLERIFQAYSSVYRNPNLGKSYRRFAARSYWAPTLLDRVFGPGA
jgi:hypothetical protein